MKYASIIVGAIILLILAGVAFGFMHRATTPVAYNYNTAVPFQASVQSGYYPAYSATVQQTAPIMALPATAMLPLTVTNVPVVAVAAAPVQPRYTAYTAGYAAATCPCAAAAVAAPIYTAAAVNYANPSATWYTTPSGPYTYSMPYNYSNVSYSANTTVYPGSSYVIPGTTQTYNYNIPGYSGGGTTWYP